MPKIILKNSTTEGATPVSLDVGEIGVRANTNDAALFWKDSAGTIKSSTLYPAPLNSPALTGTPTAPTATSGTNTSQIATTEFVTTALSSFSSDSYKTITDGTTSAVASGADTFKIRTSGSGISAVVASNDATHGDNLLLSLDTELQALAGLTSAADAVPIFTGSGTANTFTVTSAARGILDDTTTTAMRSSLGLGSIATQDSSSVSITGGSITGITDLALADGGTGASTASEARTNLGLGSISTQDASSVTITGGSISGITDLAIADGGTGASTAANARTNLGLGSMSTQETTSYYTKTAADAAFQPLDSTLTALAGLTANGILVQTATDTYTARNLSAGTGISISNSDAVSGNPTITNTAPDQTVALTSGTGINVTGTYPNFTIANTGIASYPSTGIANSTGTGWGTSYTTSGSGTVLALTTSASLTSPTLTTPSLSGETFSTSATVSAAGSTQGTGTALTSDYNVITTAASGSGVVLPTATTGRRIIVVNKGANALAIYPASGATIDALSANASISLPVNGVMIFNASSTTQWYSSYNISTPATSGAVSSISFGSTGLTPSTASTGAITVAGTLASTNGGTGNGFFKVSGPAAAERTFTFPNANATILTDNAAVTVAQGGTGSTTGNLSSCTADGTNAVGFLGIPQVGGAAKTGAYPVVLADAGKHIYYNSSTAYTTTIPANGSVAFPIGTALTFVNTGTANVTIAITTDTMYLAGTGSTGSRTLAQWGVATAMKLSSTTWVISGTNLT